MFGLTTSDDDNFVPARLIQTYNAPCHVSRVMTVSLCRHATRSAVNVTVSSATCSYIHVQCTCILIILDNDERASLLHYYTREKALFLFLLYIP